MSAPLRKGSQPRNLLEKAAFVAEQLASLGMPIKAGSRLARERAVFLNDDGSPRIVKVGDADLDKALEADRDFTLYDAILDPWPFPDMPRALAKLRDSLQDEPEQGEEEETPGRDTLVEVFTSVEMHRAGFEPEFVETILGRKTPDLRCRVTRRHFFVEAKRVKSRRQLLRRVKKAIEQINETGCPGALHIDVTRAFTQPGKGTGHVRYFGETDAQHRAGHYAWLESEIRNYESVLFEALHGSRVVGILFQDHQLRKLGEYGTTLSSVACAFPNPYAPEANASWRELCRGVDLGWNRWAGQEPA